MAGTNSSSRASELSGSRELDVRIEDYLNDKLQTHADLENIDVLLRNVLDQQTLLQQQLTEARVSFRNATTASQSHSSDVRKQAEEFQARQESIDRRLLIVTHSDTSDDAVKDFEASMAKLRRLDIAKGYIDLLNRVQQLSDDTRKNFNKSPQDALRPYIQLRELAFALKQAQPAAEDAAPHLVDHVENVASSLWVQMKKSFASDFEKTLKKMKWPDKDVTLAGSLEEEWNAGIERLLEIQEPELHSRERNGSASKANMDPLVLLPLEVMIKPLELRFRYHFEGEKPTNRLDKPEYFLSHVVGLLNSYDEFFAVYLQPVLSKHFKNSSLALNSVYIDSTSALITAVLPMLRHKISNLLPAISKQSQLLSHFMHELMSFDTSLRGDWGYDGGFGAEGWKGLTCEVLDRQNWFPKWLHAEKDFALSRYENIIEPDESREIDYDSVGSGVTKPTKAAIRVNDLLESVTDRYRLLQSFSQKLRFLIDIQITIFDQFHSALHSSLEAYLAMTSSLARTVQGISKEEQAKVEGLNGLERLCRVYGSAEYLEKKMRDWSDDVFFLELWDELQYRARQDTEPGQTLAGDFSIADVAGRTSNNVGSNGDGGALFDETAASYHRLRVRTEDIMQENLNYDIRESLRPYGRITPWASISAEVQNLTELSISTELDNTIQKLTSYLSFLHKILADAPLRRIARQLALTIQAFIWDTVLLRNNFSTSGVAQFQRDVEGLWAVFDRYTGSGQGRLGMRRLADALVLIGMPFRGSESTEGKDDGSTVSQLGIRDIDDRIFESNESARDVLEELDLENLTVSEARTVLGRRVELAR